MYLETVLLHKFTRTSSQVCELVRSLTNLFFNVAEATLRHEDVTGCKSGPPQVFIR